MTLARPDFIERSPDVIEPEVTSAFEAALGKTLFPGQLERLLLNIATYRELLVRIGIQSAAEQNLDQLGALLAVTRLAATSASVTLQFTRASTAGSLTIPAGTSARQPGSSVIFATQADATIANGQLNTTVTAIATNTGPNANGFNIGTITQVIEAPTGVTAVTNTTASAGGSDTETDNAFRTRIKLAPNQFSVAGSKGAYKFHALSADVSIIDVAVLGPEDRGGADPVTVDVYPLTNDGLPSSLILGAVTAALNLDTIRPLTDIVNVSAPIEVSYDITALVTIFDAAEQSIVEAALTAAINAYTTERASRLGNDIVLSQIIEALQSVDGVYSVSLTDPVSSIAVGLNEWAKANVVDVAVVGINAG